MQWSWWCRESTRTSNRLTPQQLLLLQQTAKPTDVQTAFLLQSLSIRSFSILTSRLQHNCRKPAVRQVAVQSRPQASLKYESTAHPEYRVRAPARPRRLRSLIFGRCRRRSEGIHTCSLPLGERPPHPHPHPHPHRTQTVNPPNPRVPHVLLGAELSFVFTPSLGLWHGRARCWHRQSGWVDWPRLLVAWPSRIITEFCFALCQENRPRAGPSFFYGSLDKRKGEKKTEKKDWGQTTQKLSSQYHHGYQMITGVAPVQPVR
ncbi:hypothetical protein B0T20DRAFT_18241 [Sordaria brevicollis]|uniref:Uncharacterized protein n=1 Tax=Sordaria brevicollis TaxID=83679 RepID=A0AAE0UGD0_SORBR|nr:hypothetical protein B0T20DRAFT_18241 [Sordaria brevicollis]